MKIPPDKIYIAEHNANVQTGYFSRNRDDVFTQEYIRKDIVDDMLKTAEDHAFLAGADWQKGSSWKPTEEQMKALEYVIRDYREDGCNATANYLQEILDHFKNM